MEVFLGREESIEIGAIGGFKESPRALIAMVA